jgi:hypothetical protein
MLSSLTTLATRRRSAADARAAQRRLRAELDSYQTPAERAELDAIFARHTTAELQELADAAGRPYAA